MRGALGMLFRQRPFVPLVALFAGGIVVSRYIGLDLSTGILLLCLATAAYPFLRTHAYVLLLCVFLAGAVLYSVRYEVLSERDLRLLVHEEPALVTVRGKLLETPSLREYPGVSNTVRYSYARLDVKEVFLNEKWCRAQGSIASATRGEFDGPTSAGRSVEVSGVLDRPPKAKAPGLFDLRAYFYNQRVFYQLRSESTNDWKLTSFEPIPLTERFRRWARQQLARGLPADDEPLQIVRAMALGDRQTLTGEMSSVFTRTGTLHIVAISGLHVACIAACILGFLRLLGVSRDRAALILIPLVWFYTVATGLQSSAVRSALMSSFVFAGWAVRRPTEILNSTAGAALVILAIQPEQLFQASFQLSFVVVGAIAVILGVSDGESWTIQVQDRLLGYDPLLPPELRPGWKRWLHAPLTFVLGTGAISFAAWIGSMPLTAYYFNLVTPVSLLANLVAVPLSSVSLAATLGSLLIPPLGPVFNYLSWATMWETIVAIRWIAEISWGYFYVPKPNGWFFLAYFTAVLVCAVPFFRARHIRRYSLATVAILCAFCLGTAVRSGRSTFLTVLAAPGNPVFIDAPGRASDLLVDCSNVRNGEEIVTQFLRGQGVGRLPNLLLSQGTVDHVGGFDVVQREFAPQRVFASLVPGRSRSYKAVLAKLESLPALRRLHEHDRISGWEVLSDLRSRRSRAEDNAIVLRGDVRGWKVLFLPGMSRFAQQELIERGVLTEADILITSVAARGEVIGADLLATIRPRLILLRAADKPFDRGGAKEAQARLGSSGLPLFSARSDGSISLEIDQSECRVSACSGRRLLLLKNR